jgi:hypothetical protein
MDPYLESPGIWPGFQHGMVTNLCASLNAILPLDHVARLKIRRYPRLPNVLGEVREACIKVAALGDQKRVVTVIELLSPANRTMGSAARIKYQRQQRAVSRRSINLLEIDLWKLGLDTVLAPVEKLAPEISFDQIVSLSRADRRGEFALWPVTYQQRLPSVPVPIAFGATDVALDLQSSLDRCYDGFAFDRDIDYSRNPPIPLSPETRKWIDALLREKGLRG